MKSDVYSSNKRLIYSMLVIFISLVSCYFVQYHRLSKNINVITKKAATIEYGSKNYEMSSILDGIDGEKISVKKDIDTKKVGKQNLVLVVSKDGIDKQLEVRVEVKDTVAPEIKIKEETISINNGDEFDINGNIEQVADIVDGDLKYQQQDVVNKEVDTNYYTIEGSVDTNVDGTYPVVIKAVDKYGNESSVTYNVVVESEVRPVVNEPTVPVANYQNDYQPVADTNGLVQLAYSLIGSPYVAGGNTPAGFDCSGFVQYLYSMMGVAISRSSSTQIYDGVGVSYDAAQPGDILSWGYAEGAPTHSALYVGNGMMIHATNPRQGVILSNVEAWTRGSGTRVIAVRRI